MADFLLIPDSDGYTGKFGSGVLATDVPGGRPRMRKTFSGAYHTVTAHYTCGPNDYNYLLAFYRTATDEGSLPFNAQLMLDRFALDTYECYFAPGTVELATQKGYSAQIALTLWVTPLVNNFNDAYTMVMYLFSIPSNFQQFDHAVNVNLANK